jgi:hypothetical protein
MEEGMKRRGLVMAQTEGKLVMPGDEFLKPTDQTKIVLGPGLKLILAPGETEMGSGGRILACKSGILRRVKGNTYFVELKSKQASIFNYEGFSTCFNNNYVLTFCCSTIPTKKTMCWAS